MSEDDGGTGQDRRASRALRLACYLDAPVRGGSSTSLATLLGALDPAIEVTVVGTSTDVVAQVAGARPGTATVVLGAVRNKADIGAVRAHVRALRALRPDVVHANLDSQWSAQYGLLASVLTRTPVVAVVHSVWDQPARVQRVLVRRLARRVDAYVGVSKYAAASTEALLGLGDGSVRVIYNGVPAPSSVAPRGDGGGPVVGAVGRLSPEKGLDVLVRAMASLPGCRLVLVGEGPQRPALEALAAQLGVTGRVTFAGWVEAPWAAHFAFDVLAVPSFSEGFGLVAVEAMLAGTPVVATAVGAVPEVVRNGETGLLVPPGEAEPLARALGRLLADAPLRATFAERGRAVATEHFATSRMAAEFETLYATLSAHRCQ